MSTVRDRVEKGAALLDEHVPGWHRVIDLKTLQLSSCENCVCGQVARHIAYGHLKVNTRNKPRGFTSMVRFLGKKLGYREPDIGEVAEEYGFETFRTNRSYELLDREWGRLIRARLKEEASA